MADDTPGDELTLEPTTVATARPRRRALWGALAAVAVAAGALAVSSGGGGDGDDELPVLPVALGATSGADSAAGEAVPSTADGRMAWVTYVAGEGLPALGGEGVAYRLAGEVDEADVRALADHLGLQGQPTHQDRVWQVEGVDGVLEVYEDGGGSWWFSQTVGDAGVSSSSGGGSADCEGGPAVDCGVDVPLTVDTATTVPAECAGGAGCPTTTVTFDCEPGTECVDTAPPECAPDAGCIVPPPIQPTPPADLPTEDVARQIALELLTATGMDVDGAKFTVDGPYDAWYVTVEPVLDGVPVSGWISSVAVGSDGVVTNASGTLGQPEALGAYPLIDTRAAVDRLNDQQGLFVSLGGAEDAPAASVSASEGCTTEPDGTERCWSTGTAVACAEPAMPPARDDVTTTIVEPCPAPAPQPVDPEPMEVVLTGAERVLVLLPSFDGSGDAYLLPGYRFSSTDGAVAEVPAVADESLAPTTTVPATDLPVSDGGIEPSQPDLTHLSEGEQPELGVGYYVDGVNTHCGTLVWADRWWATDAQTPLPWSDPTEGGIFTLSSPDEGTFVGDAAGTKTAVFTARGPADDQPPCA